MVERNRDLLEYPVVIDDDFNMYLLHLAVGVDSDERNNIVTYLLQQPEVKVDQRSGLGNDLWTAAHIACCYGHASTLKILLEHGADPYALDSNGLTLWDIAQAFDNFTCIFAIERHLLPLIEDSDTSSRNRTISVDSDDDTYYSIVDITDDKPTMIYDLSQLSANSCNSSRTCRIHNDKQFGISLLEVTLNPNHNDRNKGEDADEHDGSIISRGPATLDQTIINLNDDALRHKLISHGDSPGPIVPTTRNIYQRRLQSLKRGTNYLAMSPGKTTLPLPKYPREVNDLILGAFDMSEAKQLELEFIKHFETQAPTKKIFFTYLLLDPRTTQNLPAAGKQSEYDKFDGQLFKRFILAIFYGGKGRGDRTFMHLYEAAIFQANDKRSAPNRKIKKILDIWAECYGVVSLHCFMTISSDEALARECLIIEALGLSNLTNIQIGQNKSRDLKWTDHKRRHLGTYLLYKAYNIFLIHGERQIKRADLSDQKTKKSA